MKPSQPNQSLIDGIAILQRVAGSSEPVSCTEISKELGIEFTRVNRILKTFAYLGITHQTKSRKYTSGPGMHVLAAQSLYGSKLLQNSMRHLEALCEFDLIVAFGVLWRNKVSFLYHWRPGMLYEEAIGSMALQPASRSGVGMILLAEKSEKEIRKIYHEKEIPGYGRNIDHLLQDIRVAGERGYSLVRENPTPINIAVKVGSPAYAALGWAGDIAEADLPRHVQTLRDVARIIEATETKT